MFERIDTHKIYLRIYEQIKDRIASGELKKGDRLPSERAMSEELGVSRASVREALRSMEIMGLIRSVQGEGNFIAHNLEHAFSDPLTIMFTLEDGSVRDVVELRRALEAEAARLAAKRATPELVEELKSLLDVIAEDPDESRRADADRRFHYTIARASGNGLIIAILNAASALMDQQIRDIRLKIMSDSNITTVNSQHRLLFDAIAANDSPAAMAAANDHLDLIEEYCCPDEDE